MSLVKSTSITVDERTRQAKDECLSLETIEKWMMYVCHLEGEWARQNI
jgi:hypothetical protein